MKIATVGKILVNSDSPAFKINKADVIRVIRVILVAMIGAGLTQAAKLIVGHDFGDYNMVAQIIATGLVELARRFVGPQTGV